MRKFKNNTRSGIGHDHKVCFIQSPEGFWFDFKARHPLNFWTTLKSLSNQVESSLDSTVPMCKLYNHFQKLHSEPNANLLKKQELILKELKYKKTTLSQLNSLDKPFSEEEVKQSIKRLKNKKAAGLD